MKGPAALQTNTLCYEMGKKKIRKHKFSILQQYYIWSLNEAAHWLSWVRVRQVAIIISHQKTGSGWSACKSSLLLYIASRLSKLWALNCCLPLKGNAFNGTMLDFSDFNICNTPLSPKGHSHADDRAFNRLPDRLWEVIVAVSAWGLLSSPPKSLSAGGRGGGTDVRCSGLHRAEITGEWRRLWCAGFRSLWTQQPDCKIQK